MSLFSKEIHLRKPRDCVHRNRSRCLDYPRFGAIKEVTSKSKWMHGAHPARIESHPVAAAFWLTASWHRGNTLPTDRGPTYVDTPTRGRVRAQCQPTTRATTPWTWTCAGLARLVAVQLESFAETLLSGAKRKGSDRPASARRRKESTCERLRAAEVRSFAEGDKWGTHDDVNRYQETAGAPGAQRSIIRAGRGEQRMRVSSRVSGSGVRGRGLPPDLLGSSSSLLNFEKTKTRAG